METVQVKRDELLETLIESADGGFRVSKILPLRQAAVCITAWASRRPPSLTVDTHPALARDAAHPPE